MLPVIWEPRGCVNGNGHSDVIVLRCRGCGATEERPVWVEAGRAWQTGRREGCTDCLECGAEDSLEQAW